MNSSKRKSALDRMVEASEAFFQALARADGIDEDLLAEFKASLIDCRIEWSGKDTIPRLAVGIFVDMHLGMDAKADSYPATEAAKIRMAAMELVALAGDAVQIED